MCVDRLRDLKHVAKPLVLKDRALVNFGQLVLLPGWHCTSRVMRSLVVWNRRPDSQTSEAGFWHQLLLASHFEFAHPTKPPKKAEGIYMCKQRLLH
ncbi:hypothetical protein B0G80_7124 [Paraburkholderia sp. BL6669N2]|nr:hypothetical protein B0G80_7124 [Paraburkholderia sp. BL6669N2]